MNETNNSAKQESRNLSDISAWYLTEQLDMDIRMVGFRFDSMRPFLRGSSCLELGPAEGQMTRFLVGEFDSVTVVDAAKDLLDVIPGYENLVKVHSLFEDFVPSQKYDSVVLDHVLEHVEDPGELLKLASHWVSPGGVLIVGVPNANSIHRLAAVKMGMLQRPDQLNPRDLALGHRRVYTPEALRDAILRAGLLERHFGGVLLKPVSYGQMESDWTEEMVHGFRELGKDLPGLAAEIFVVAENENH
jgi:2-polyprenyl-3-methyl-5-hydroxy-6-metoxy-1,4-benzoquinol methylase